MSELADHPPLSDRDFFSIYFHIFYRHVHGVYFHWSESHLSMVYDYFVDLHQACDFEEVHARIPVIGMRSSVREDVTSFARKLKNMFMVPRLGELHEKHNCIKKYQLVEVFIVLLLKLLYHKADSIIDTPCEVGIENLEKELRFLFTVLGDASLMLCVDDDGELEKLVAEFEAVANEAGSLVHSLFFSLDYGSPAFGEMDDGIAVVLDHIRHLKADIMEHSISKSANYITPKTCVVDSLVIVNSLTYYLKDLLNWDHEDNQLILHDAKDQIKTLHRGLILVQSSIKDIGSPQPSEIGELKELLARIGDMASTGEYLINSFLVGDAPLCYLINRLANLNPKIGLIGIEIREIADTHKVGGLKLAMCSNTQPSLQDDHKRNPEGDGVTIGLEDKAEDILHHLVDGIKHLQVITIHGMPGLGKTTLAQKLYNHPLVNDRFDKLSWCVISQTYQRRSILTHFFTHLTTEPGKYRTSEMDEEILLEHIYKTLKGRRYLIVMDDIWDSNAWDDLRRCFPDDCNGSRILLTTRNEDVAPPESKNYALCRLSNDQCWELLEKKVFDGKPCPPELLEIGKRIAANCRGLPLSVVVIAGILSMMDKVESTWKEVEGNLASYIIDGGDNSVKEILELSYKHLQEHLKPCFLYFAAFQEDEEIPVRVLMRLWIAEGFIHEEDGRSAENVAEGYLMKLIDKSLVMVAKRRSDGGVKACVIHDLLRDLCFKRCEDENFLKFLKDDCSAISGKGYCLQEVDSEYFVTSIYYRHTRSLCLHPVRSSLYVRKARLLRVLHYDLCHLTTPYIGIEYLVSLRYLVICAAGLTSAVNLEYFHMESLVNLEYLRVESSILNGEVYLPSAIMKMKKLRYIHVLPEAIYHNDWNSSQINNLEYLSNVLIREYNPKDKEILKCSPRLRKLKCRYETCKFDDLQGRHIDLRFLTQLESLNIKLHGHVFKEISFPSNIKKLTLSGGFTWSLVKSMSVIASLENIEALKLEFFYFLGGRWTTSDGEFQKLKFLKLRGRSLTEWNVESSQHFPVLQRLVLWDCENLQEIPSEIGEITTLQLIEVKGKCRESMVESAKRIRQEQLDMGNEELRITIRACSSY